MKRSAKRIFWNALLLTAATLLVRTVSVTFGVYVSNLAGAEAMGLLFEKIYDKGEYFSLDDVSDTMKTVFAIYKSARNGGVEVNI